MYTVIFLRNRTQDTYNSAIHIECFCTEKEVHNFIRFKTFQQERLESDAIRYRSERLLYGDYGYLVLKNGETIFERNFEHSIDEYDIPPYSDDFIECYQDCNVGVNQNANLNLIYKNLDKVEKEYNISLQSYREEVKKQEEISKEKALLKILLEKYPDVK